MKNPIYHFSQLLSEYKEFIFNLKRVNQWEITPKDKDFLKNEFFPRVIKVPKTIDPGPISRYVESVFTPAICPYKEFIKKNQWDTSFLRQMILDAQALVGFGWMTPYEDWPEIDLITATPTPAYQDYVSKEIMHYLNWTSPTSIMPNSAIKIVKSMDPLNDHIRINNLLNNSVEEIITYMLMQQLLATFSLQAVDFDEDGSIKSIVFESFHFLRDGASVHAVIPEFIREQGLSTKFPSKVLKYMTSKQLLSYVKLGSITQDAPPLPEDDQGLMKQFGLQVALSDVLEIDQKTKSNWTFDTFCEELHKIYVGHGEREGFPPLTASTRPDEIRKAVVRHYKAAGINLKAWILRADAEFIDDISDLTRSLLRFARTSYTPEMQHYYRDSTFQQTATSLAPANPLLIRDFQHNRQLTSDVQIKISKILSLRRLQVIQSRLNNP